MMLKARQNRKHYGTVRTLLLNCVKLLDQERHPQVNTPPGDGTQHCCRMGCICSQSLGTYLVDIAFCTYQSQTLTHRHVPLRTLVTEAASGTTLVGFFGLLPIREENIWRFRK